MPIKSGSCHCHKVTFQVDVENIFENIYRCDCSLCKKKSIVMKPVPIEKFKLLKGKDNLNSYKWNKRIAEHFFCNTCGVYTHHKRRRDPTQFSINLACLDGITMPKEDQIQWIDGSSHI